MDFYPFPSTLNVIGSFCGENEINEEFLNDENIDIPTNMCLRIQEKMDGMCVGIHFREDAQPVLMNRKKVLDNEDWTNSIEYGAFYRWAAKHLQDLYQALGDRFVLFGEWVFRTNGVKYDSLTDYFLAFDVQDKHSMQFLSFPRVQLVLESTFVCLVPELVSLPWQPASDNIIHLTTVAQQYISASQFSSVGEMAEGVYFRLETESQVVDRWKFRRRPFLRQPMIGTNEMETNLLLLSV